MIRRGRHINSDGVPHGLRHPEGPDHGDLPNLYVDRPDGSARAEFFTVVVVLPSPHYKAAHAAILGER